MREENRAVMLSLTPCPDPSCGASAEVTDRITVGSTGGPMEHVRTLCLNGHRFCLPTAHAYRAPSARDDIRKVDKVPDNPGGSVVPRGHAHRVARG
jgi:hypothetical protein